MLVTIQNRQYTLTESTLQPELIQQILQRWQQKNAHVSIFDTAELTIIYLQKPTYTTHKHCLNDYDRGRFLFARQYLLDHVTLPPSIEELARIVGINSFKLKNGFKELFGETIYGYLSRFRMEMAKTLILEGERSMTQIAFELGFSSLQHFSAAFKRAYGCSPKKIKTAVQHPE